MESVLSFIFTDEENDLLFIRGEKKGIEKGSENRDRELVGHLIINKKMTDEQIADLTNIALDFIANTRNEI